MVFNPSDTRYLVAAETTPGTTPANPTLLPVDHIPSGGGPNYTADLLKSEVQRPNRVSPGARKVNWRVEDGLKVHAKRDAAVDLFLQSGLTGTWVSNTLTAAATTTSFTVEKRMVDGSTTQYVRYTGEEVTKTTLACEAAGNAELTFDFLGLGSTWANTALTGSTVANASTTTLLAGPDVTVSVAGLTVDYSSLEINVTRDCEVQSKFGTTSGRGIGQKGPREVTANLKFYRNDMTPETLFLQDTPVSLTVSLGSGANGYTFNLPACIPNFPKSNADGSSEMVEVEFYAKDDANGVDIKVTRP